MDYQWFIHQFRSLSGIDLALYKENQMKRRIDYLIEKSGTAGYEDYVALLRQDQAALETLCGYITINVTEFFRTPDHWEQMLQTVAPRLSNPRIWSVACSTGEEPYSLLMSLSEHMPIEEVTLLATDIDKRVIELAKRGEYSEQAIAAVPERFRKRFFSKTESGYRVSEAVMGRVEFRHMDVLQDELPTGFDLIVCRNVLIYFTDEAKDYLFRFFYDCLNPGGFLFTGNTEQLLNYRQLGFRKLTGFLYQRV